MPKTEAREPAKLKYCRPAQGFVVCHSDGWFPVTSLATNKVDAWDHFLKCCDIDYARAKHEYDTSTYTVRKTLKDALLKLKRRAIRRYRYRGYAILEVTIKPKTVFGSRK